MTRLLVIGGSDAGISAALRARELEPSSPVTVAVADRYPNDSICGLPFYLSGEVPDWRRLAHRTVEEIEAQGVSLLLEHTARRIDPLGKTVEVVDSAGNLRLLEYDRLIIATGAEPVRPPIRGLDLPGVNRDQHALACGPTRRAHSCIGQTGDRGIGPGCRLLSALHCL